MARMWASLALAATAAASASESCATNFQDNWGVTALRGSSTSAHPFVSGAAEEVKCDFVYSDMDQVEKAAINWYPSSIDFKEFRGFDLVPSRHWEYANTTEGGYERETKLLHEGLKKWVPGQNGPRIPGGKIRLGECEVPQEDGGAWIVQRVGPFVSTGNYDFWQFGWKDIFRMSKVLDRSGGSVYISGSFFAGVRNETGEILGFPPIHSHHIHVAQTPNVKTKFPAKEEFMPNFVVEQHGDYECQRSDGGIRCLFEKPAGDFMKELHMPLDIEGEFNDARAPNSEPMTWWFTTALRWHPKTTPRRTVSQLFAIAQAKQNSSDQLATLATFDVPTKEPSLFWYSGKMPRDGDLVRNKLHAHTLAFDRALWFRASPSDLGLIGDASKNFTHPFRNEPHGGGFYPLPMRQTGLPDFAAVEQYLLGNLAKAAERHAKSCPASRAFLRSNRRDECGDRAPILVCKAHNSDVEIFDETTGQGYYYDRRPPTCCRPWRFHRGDVFTAIGFYRPLKKLPGPWETTMPAVYPEHLHFVLTFAPLHPTDDSSEYMIATYTPYLSWSSCNTKTARGHLISCDAALAETTRIQEMRKRGELPVAKRKELAPPPEASEEDESELAAEVSLMQSELSLSQGPAQARVRALLLGRREAFLPLVKLAGLLPVFLLAVSSPCRRRAAEALRVPCAMCPAPCLPRMTLRYLQQGRSD